MRVLFIGGTRRGYAALKALVDDGQAVVGVISLEQDEHESERFEERIETLAREQDIPHLRTRRLKDQDFPKIVGEMRPDIAIVVGCRQLIPRELHSVPRLGTLAVHDSLLPRYRGFAPLNWSILNGEDHTGVTLFFVHDSVDSGDVVSQARIPIGETDSALQVYERVCDQTVRLVLEACRAASKGPLPRLPQDEAAATYTCSRLPADGVIDWTQPTKRIHDLIRALTHPYPGAFTHFKGKKLFIWSARPAPERAYAGRIPGRVVALHPGEGSVDVLTGDGALRIGEVQVEGMNRLEASALITSVRCALGLSSAELLSRIEALERKLARRARKR